MKKKINKLNKGDKISTLLIKMGLILMTLALAMTFGLEGDLKNAGIDLLIASILLQFMGVYLHYNYNSMFN